MNVQELYDWAKSVHALHFDIIIPHRDEDGTYQDWDHPKPEIVDAPDDMNSYMSVKVITL